MDLFSASVPNGSSYLWQSFMWGGELLKMGLRWRIGDGARIGAFLDPWIPGSLSFRPITTLSHPSILVQEFIMPTRSWNVDRLRQVFWLVDAHSISSLPLSWSSMEDRLIWHYDIRGEYSVKTGYCCDFNAKLLQECGVSKQNSK